MTATRVDLPGRPRPGGFHGRGRAVLGGGKSLDEPFGVSFDGAGNTYIVEMGGNRVRVLGGDGQPRVLAGTGEKGLAGEGGPAARARLNGPHHLLTGPDGSIDVADTFHNCVRRIDLKTRLVTRVAGTGGKGVSGDGGPALSEHHRVIRIER